MKRGQSQSPIEIQLSHLGGGADPPPMQLPQGQERIAQLLKLFSSARKRPGLTPDEVLIFFSVGYLGLSMSKGVVFMRSVRQVDVATLLGMPKETVRRKTMRLANIDYVSVSRDGIIVKRLDILYRMFELALN